MSRNELSSTETALPHTAPPLSPHEEEVKVLPATVAEPLEKRAPPALPEATVPRKVLRLTVRLLPAQTAPP